MWDHPLLSDLLSEIAKSKENILFGSSLYFFLFFFHLWKAQTKIAQVLQVLHVLHGEGKKIGVAKTNFCNFVLNICSAKYWNTTETSDLGK